MYGHNGMVVECLHGCDLGFARYAVEGGGIFWLLELNKALQLVLFRGYNNMSRPRRLVTNGVLDLLILF